MKTVSATLPSKGLLNRGELLSDSVTLKEMDISAEKELLSNNSFAQKIIAIVRNSIVTPESIDVLNLPINDIMALFFEARALSLDSGYSFRVVCEACDFQYNRELPIPHGLDRYSLPDDIEEPIPFQLSEEKRVEIRYLRGYDLIEIENHVKAVVRNQAKGFRVNKLPDHAEVTARNVQYIYRLAKQIKSVNGQDVSVSLAQAFIDKLSYAESNELKDCLDSIDFGYDMDVQVQCPRCGFEDTHTVQITKDFFRPKRSAKPRRAQKDN